MKRAIVFTLYQRPFYTRQVLDAWSKVRGLWQWDVHFFIDPSPQAEAQLEIASEFLRTNKILGSVTVNEGRLGVLTAPWHALETAFAGLYERVVLAEEDVEVGDDVLEYFEEALWLADIACAWSDKDAAEDEIDLRRKWFNPWGWATNKDTWYGYLKDSWDHDYSTADERGPGGWDCNIGLRLVHDTDLTVAFPRASRSRHIGQHLGSHQDPREFGVLEMPPSFKAHREPVHEWLSSLREDA